MYDVLLGLGDFFYLIQTLADEFNIFENRWE